MGGVAAVAVGELLGLPAAAEGGHLLVGILDVLQGALVHHLLLLHFNHGVDAGLLVGLEKGGGEDEEDAEGGEDGQELYPLVPRELRKVKFKETFVNVRQRVVINSSQGITILINYFSNIIIVSIITIIRAPVKVHGKSALAFENPAKVLGSGSDCSGRATH